MAAATSNASVLAGSKLIYFPVPGRGEALRLALVSSNIKKSKLESAPNKEKGIFSSKFTILICARVVTSILFPFVKRFSVVLSGPITELG
jgi:hypothetical protein